MSRASNYKKRLQTKESLTAEIELPSGEVFVCRRPPLQTWITAGKVPQSFVKQLVSQQNVPADKRKINLSTDDSLATMYFMRDAVLYAVVEPKLVAGTQAEDELDPADIDPEDFEFLMGWIMGGCVGVPVATKGGEIAVDDLARFREVRQKRTHGQPFSLNDNGSEIREAA